MAAGVRFTKAEREYLRGLLDDPRLVGTPIAKYRDSILEKLEKSELVKGNGRAPGIEYPVILSAFESVLGERLVKPIGAAVGMVVGRARTLGLTCADCVTIAKVAGAKWRGFIKAESLVRQAEVLLHEAQLDLPLPGTPVGMEEL